MRALCDEAENVDKIREEWSESVRECNEIIRKICSGLEQKGKKVKLQEVISDEDNVLTFIKCVVKKA